MLRYRTVRGYDVVDEERGLNRLCRERRARRKVQCARGIIIHPAHYPSTGTIDDPTPTPPPPPSVVTAPLKRASSSPLGTYLGLYARKMNSVISRSRFPTMIS
ncbi:hypothetical protein WH47_05114 [Habropoda laboriosa]|uniref:Uncharacterized protein n=1 Tax=Habropoda laboriosa TaxID=597456 RepID=A0A0L7QS84_9HYME|nr:hypothetical protein WH47_05114 [Habropoda laboriosa]